MSRTSIQGQKSLTVHTKVRRATPSLALTNVCHLYIYVKKFKFYIAIEKVHLSGTALFPEMYDICHSYMWETESLFLLLLLRGGGDTTTSFLSANEEEDPEERGEILSGGTKRGKRCEHVEILCMQDGRTTREKVFMETNCKLPPVSFTLRNFADKVLIVKAEARVNGLCRHCCTVSAYREAETFVQIKSSPVLEQ